MKKTILVGSTTAYARPAHVFVTIKYADGRLSITGVVGPKNNGDAIGGCGQITDTLTAPDFTPAGNVDTVRLAEVWDRWHLNDLRAGCTHQRATWDVSQVLTLSPLTWGPAYHAARRRAESGTATAEEYAEYQRIAPIVQRLTTAITRPKHPQLWGADGDALLTAGYVTAEREEQKTAGWVRPDEHPDGLLGKPCPTCGYKYGTAWLREDVPDDVLAFLDSLPASPVALPSAWT